MTTAQKLNPTQRRLLNRARLKISKSAVYRRCFAAGLPIVEKQAQ